MRGARTYRPAGCVLLLAAVGAAGCGHGPGGGKRRGFVERLPRLEVVSPERRYLKRRLDLAATVEPLKKVVLNARVPGVVSYLPDHIDIGRKVTRGEVLLKLAVPDLEAENKQKEAVLEQSRKQQAQAAEALAVAQREVEEAVKEEKRYAAELAYFRLKHTQARELYQRGAQKLEVVQEAVKQVEAADAALEANRAKQASRRAKVRLAGADLEVAKKRIDVAAADVRKVTEQIAFATIQAPFDAVITRRWVDPGATIKDPGAALLTVEQVDRVRVLIDVPQRDVPYLNAREHNPRPDGQGDPVTVTIPALREAPNRGEFQGTVTRVSRSLDPVTRTMRAEVELPNKDGLLRPGMFGTASVLVEERENALVIPATALVRRDEGKVQVYCVTETSGDGEERRGVLRLVEVSLGIDDGKLVEVRSGLKGDELIVRRGNGVMRAEDRVIAVPEREPSGPGQANANEKSQ